jgi:hypothetical protein
MISTISAYKEMLLSSASGKAGQQSGTVAENGASGSTEASPAKPAGPNVNALDPVELSVSHDVFSAVDDYFNLGKSGRFDAFHKLSRDDKEQFVKIVAELAKAGYAGYEELIVNKKIEKHEVLNQVGDDRLRNAKVYDRPKTPGR